MIGSGAAFATTRSGKKGELRSNQNGRRGIAKRKQRTKGECSRAQVSAQNRGANLRHQAPGTRHRSILGTATPDAQFGHRALPAPTLSSGRLGVTSLLFAASKSFANFVIVF